MSGRRTGGVGSSGCDRGHFDIIQLPGIKLGDLSGRSPFLLFLASESTGAVFGKFALALSVGMVIDVLIAAFQAFGRIPNEIVFDCSKPFVAPTLTSFAAHRGFVIARRGPLDFEDKALVERVARQILEGFAPGQEVQTLAELNKRFRDWIAKSGTSNPGEARA